MMEKAEPNQKLHTRMRLWEFPDEYVIEPTDGSSGSSLSINRVDGSMTLTDNVPECSSVRVPKIQTIFGIVGVIKLVAGSYLFIITERECVGFYLGHPIYRVVSLKVLPCDHSVKKSTAEQRKVETEFSSLLNVAEKTHGLYFSYETNLTLSAQRLHALGDESKLLPLWRQAEPRFLWNNYMLELLIDNKLDPYLLPVIQGSTRLWRRGADPDGYVANFVESEQILQMNGFVASFVQVRGSMPFTWEQIVDLTYKPKFEIIKPEEAPQVAERHILDLRKKFGSVITIDLVNKHGGEGRLSEKFASSMQHLVGDDVRYLLLNEKGEKMKEQTGVVRINCIDCLDRTNVTQSMIARKMLESQLRRIGVFGAEETVSTHPNFDEHYKILWADHGDDISTQYSGTPALKGDFVRYGKRTPQGILKDGWNALVRYYLNNFCDGTKQDAIDLVHGHYIVSVNRDMSPPLSKAKGLEAVASFPIALFLVLTGLYFATSSLGQVRYDIRHMFFSAFWAAISVAIAAFVRENGRVFCNRPRLHKPRR